MDPTTPRCRRSRPRAITATKEKSSNGIPRGSITPSTPRTKAGEFFVSTPSTVHSDSACEDDFPFDSSGEWSISRNAFQTPKRESPHTITKEKLRCIQSCSPLQQLEESTVPRRHRRRMSTRTDHSNETNETNDSSLQRSPRRRPRRTASAVKLEEEFLVVSATPVPAKANPETPRRIRRSSSVEPRRRRTASIERRRTGNGDVHPPRRRLSMTKIGSASPPSTPEMLQSPAARRLARHAQSVQQLTREKPPLLRQTSMEEANFTLPRTPKRQYQ